MAINSNKVDRILEQLNEAMMRASEAAAARKPADLTVLAEIVDDTTIANGYYIVWDGSVRYKAYSEKTNYKKGQKVYVLIPEGDTSKQKQITGRYFQETEKIVTINGDWDEYYPLYYLTPIEKNSNMNYVSKKEYSLIVNKDIENPIPIISIGDTTNKVELQNRKYLGISFDYFCNLGYDVLRNSGYFNLEVLVNYAPSLKGSTKQKDTYVKTYGVSSRDILGDPFNYLSWHNVKSLIELNPENADDKISSVEVSFKQIGQFATAEGDPYPVAKKPNLGIKNIEISFGNYKTNLGDELTISTLQGTDYDSAQKEEINRKRINLRWVHTGVSDDGKKSSVEIKEGDTFPAYGIKNRTIRWYQNTTKTLEQRNEDIAWQNTEEKTLGKLWHDAQEEGLDDLDSSYWELLINSFRLAENRHYIENGGKKSLTADGEELIENAIQSYNDTLELLDSSVLEDAKEHGQIPSETPQTEGHSIYEQEIQDNDSKVFTLIFDPPTNRQDCDVWAEVEIEFDNGDIITAKSNVLTFKNKQNVPDEGTMIAARKVEISLLDGSEGNYAIYDEGSGKMISDIYDRQRIMVVECFDESGINCLNGSEEIMWAIPNNNSMIKFNDSDKAWVERDELLSNLEGEEKKKIKNFIDYSKEKMLKAINKKYGTYSDKYDYIYRAGIKHDNTYYAVDKTQKYRLENYFNHSKTNNVVKCYIKKNNILIEGSVSFNFKQYIVPTTAYKLQLSLGDVYKYENNKFNWLMPSNNVVKISNNETNNNIWVEVLMELYDQNNKEVKLTNEQKNSIIKMWTKQDGSYNIEGFYSGYYTASNSSFYPGWVKGDNGQNYIRYFIRINKNNPLTYRFLALRGRTSVLIDANEDGMFDNTEKRFCYSVLPIQTKKCHYLKDNDTINPDKMQDIAALLGGNYEQNVFRVAVPTGRTVLSLKENTSSKELSLKSDLNDDLYIPISIVDVEEYVFDRLVLESAYGYIQYDEKNANPKYAKDKITLKYNKEKDNDELNHLLNEEIPDMIEIIERYIMEYNTNRYKSATSVIEKKTIAQWLIEEVNDLYTRVAQLKVTEAIGESIAKNGKVICRIIYPGMGNELEAWMPSISDAGRLQVPSAYIEHDKNDLALEVKLCLKTDEDGSNPFVTFYQPIVMISSKDNIPVVDEEWEGKTTKTGGGKKAKSSNGSIIVQESIPETNTRRLMATRAITPNETSTRIAGSSLSYLKAEDNKISGLVMGEIQSQYPWTNPTEPTKYINALAGYKNGVQMFELNNDGNLYLGTPPSTNSQGGGLRFDGDGAFIEGGYSYDEENGFVPGMTINFNTGAITSNKNIDLVYSSSNDGHFSVSDGTTNNRIYLNNRGFNLTTAGDVNIKSGNLKINSGSVTVGSSSNFSVSSSNVVINLSESGTFRVSNDDSWITLDSSNFNIYTKKGSIDLIYGQNAHFMVANAESWSNATSGIYMHRLNNKDRIDIKSNGDIDLTGATVTLQNTNDTGHLILTENGGINLKATTFDLSAGTGQNSIKINNVDGINLGNGKFTVDNAGALTAKSGIIAGWTLNPNYFISRKSENGDYWAGMAPYGAVMRYGVSGSVGEDDYVAFWAGNIQGFTGNSFNHNPDFFVTYDGAVHGKLVTDVDDINNNLPNYVLKTELDTLVSNAGYAKTANLNISNWNTAYSMRHSHGSSEQLTLLNSISNLNLIQATNSNNITNVAKLEYLINKINEIINSYNSMVLAPVTTDRINLLGTSWATLNPSNG